MNWFNCYKMVCDIINNRKRRSRSWYIYLRTKTTTIRGFVAKKVGSPSKSDDENGCRHQKVEIPAQKRRREWLSSPKNSIFGLKTTTRTAPFPKSNKFSPNPKTVFSLVSVSSINLSVFLLADRAPLNIPVSVGFAVCRLVHQHDKRCGQMGRIHNV